MQERKFTIGKPASNLFTYCKTPGSGPGKTGQCCSSPKQLAQKTIQHFRKILGAFFANKVSHYYFQLLDPGACVPHKTSLILLQKAFAVRRAEETSAEKVSPAQGTDSV